ncbi:hypothetical protein QJS10_CPA16g00006 [Acorus calamus]|uniref:Uncharacterized protein n=1 Tax=Acorus calamus TaxID=4465 RepID=A0AAV9D236_ACOCL|nr:hypothetical protein QJS10_CPA16g00006 [Acorus calamus]
MAAKRLPNMTIQVSPRHEFGFQKMVAIHNLINWFLITASINIYIYIYTHKKKREKERESTTTSTTQNDDDWRRRS